MDMVRLTVGPTCERCETKERVWNDHGHDYWDCPFGIDYDACRAARLPEATEMEVRWARVELVNCKDCERDTCDWCSQRPRSAAAAFILRCDSPEKHRPWLDCYRKAAIVPEKP